MTFPPWAILGGRMGPPRPGSTHTLQVPDKYFLVKNLKLPPQANRALISNQPGEKQTDRLRGTCLLFCIYFDPKADMR